MNIGLYNGFNLAPDNRNIQVKVDTTSNPVFIDRGVNRSFNQKKLKLALKTLDEHPDRSAYFIHVDYPKTNFLRIKAESVMNDWVLTIIQEKGNAPGATAKLIGEKKWEIKLIYKAGDEAGAAVASGNVRIGDGNQ